MTKVSEIIKMLSTYSPDEEIAIAWWDKETFEDYNQNKIKDEAWGKVIDMFDDVTRYPQEQIWNTIIEVIIEEDGYIDINEETND